MPSLKGSLNQWASAACMLTALLPATAGAADLSRYREFQLGSDLATVSKQAGVSPLKATTVHRRPALIQGLEWRPQPLGASTKTEPVQQVDFSFYNGELFRIVVNYDRYEIEGLTTQDFIDAISANFGMATIPAAAAKTSSGLYGDDEEALAQWQDDLYRFDLLRTAYGSGFRLVGVSKQLESRARTAAQEAARLDEKEAPARDASRLMTEAAENRAKLEKARAANKPRFRP